MSKTIYPATRKSDKVVVPKKPANKGIGNNVGGVGGGKGFD